MLSFVRVSTSSKSKRKPSQSPKFADWKRSLSCTTSKQHFVFCWGPFQNCVFILTSVCCLCSRNGRPSQLRATSSKARVSVDTTHSERPFQLSHLRHLSRLAHISHISHLSRCHAVARRGRAQALGGPILSGHRGMPNENTTVRRNPFTSTLHNLGI